MAILASGNATENATELKNVSVACLRMKEGEPMIYYCTISFNSALSVTRYQLAEILISAGPRFECDIQIFSAGRV